MTPRKRSAKGKTSKKTARKTSSKRSSKSTSSRKPTKKSPKSASKSSKKILKSAKRAQPPKKAARRSKRKPPAEEFLQQLAMPEQEERRRTTYPVVEWADNDRVRTAARVLKELARRGKLSDWRINFVHARSANLYAGRGGRIEDSLRAQREDLSVTVYRRSGETIGEATVPLITDDEQEMKDELLKAAEVCEHIRKPAYDLPEPVDGLTFPESADEKTLTAFMEGNELRIPLALHRDVVDALEGVTSNCHEILTTAAAVRVMNSNGVDVSYHRTVIYVEITLAAKEKGEEQEHHWYTVVASPDQLDLRADIERAALAARDAVIAAPNPGFTGDVLLAGQSLTDFFTPGETHNPLILHTGARLKLMGISRLAQGERIGTFEGEPFTITSDPHLPHGLLTAPVDEEGTPLDEVELIRTGVFATHIATSQYAKRLGLPLTGAMSNVHVGDGATREEHLRGQNYFEVVSFSWFNPDPFSGDFSAEVRLGYHWLRGKKTPFRGGTFTGNVFDNLLRARFSREAMQSGRYYGPRAVLFKNAVVTKRES